MIRTTYEQGEIIGLYIKYHLPFDVVFTFLQNRGYTVKQWLWKYTDETFPGGISYHESWTFTATKENEPQSEKNLFLSVFEKELKELLKEF